MKVFLVLAALVAIGLAKPAHHDSSDEWGNYKVKFNKTYKTKEEESYRKGIYFKTKEMIISHNSRYDAGLETYFMGINQFADMLTSEVVAMLDGYKMPSAKKVDNLTT